MIDDELFRALKHRAAEENRTLSDVTQEVLRRGLRPARPARAARRIELPSFRMGPPLVDLADRDQLQDVLDRS